jgi:MerR family mercuric resistance operon transcriptional regulator
MKIGTLARAAGVSVDTLRFYERRGLLPAPARMASYRAYAPQALDRVRFIRDAKRLGFTLAEIGELLNLPDVPRASCAALRKRCARKRDEIEARIRDLQRMQQALETMLAHCAARQPRQPCEGAEALRRAARPGGRRAVAAGAGAGGSDRRTHGADGAAPSRRERR